MTTIENPWVGMCQEFALSSENTLDFQTTAREKHTPYFAQNGVHIKGIYCLALYYFSIPAATIMHGRLSYYNVRQVKMSHPPFK
jgi:hypothetical protein